MISLLEAGIDNFMLLASDVNLEVLKNCRTGLYRKEHLVEVPRHILAKYFNAFNCNGEWRWQVKSELRDRILLRRINLLDKIRFEQDFHYIFCRNVMIYFDKQTQYAVVGNLLNNLALNGCLFVGHSEPLVDNKENLTTLDVSVYRKRY